MTTTGAGIRNSRFALALGLPLAYFLAAGIAIRFFGVNSPVWYANALALTALLRQPRARWPGVLALMWGADTAALLAFGDGPAPLLAVCDVIEVSLAALLIRWSGGLPSPLFSGWQMARVAATCLLVPLVSSALGAGLLAWSAGVPFLREWATWYLASALGLLLVTPFLLAWTDEQLRSRELRQAGWRQLVVAGSAALVGVALIFSVQHPVALFVSFPLMLLITWHLGLLGASSAALAVAAVATTVTLQGFGPIARLTEAGDMVQRVQSLQFYLTCLLFTSLPLAALFSHLRAMAQARTEFLAAMSHEIRTPMTAVLGMADLLHREELPAHLRRAVDTIRISGSHLLNVINDILDFSRLQSGSLQLDDTAFSVADVIEQVRSISSPLALERRLDCAFDVASDIPALVRGDPGRLRQVLLNIVGNAIKFTERGSVRTAVSRVATGQDTALVRLRFQVRDTGIGIPQEHQREIFAAFTQADNSTSRKYGGSGLGLAISHRIVRAMGGAIQVDSRVGEGSLFAFEIPLRPADATAQAVPAAAAITPPGGLSVLVVEDVDVNREILGHALTRAGNAVEFALDGQQAVEQVRTRRFDLVLMDVQMPVMDGVEATRRIRQLGGDCARLPIVGITANVMAHARESHLAAGMDACLGKPIVWDELWTTIAHCTGRADAARPQRPPTPAAQPDAPALVDMTVIDRLRPLAPGPALPKMLASTLATAEQCCAALAGNDPADLAALAHRLKGTAGTFGLAKLSDLAARTEALAAQGRQVQPLVGELQQALQDTRSELQRLGLTPPATGG